MLHSLALPALIEARIASQAIAMLLCAYATAIGLALRLPELFCVPVMAGGHAVLACALVLKVRARSCAPRAARINSN